ncbi:MAG: hypothetical protein AAF488_00415 [Planctomycetota bacterium]
MRNPAVTTPALRRPAKRSEQTLLRWIFGSELRTASAARELGFLAQHSRAFVAAAVVGGSLLIGGCHGAAPRTLPSLHTLSPFHTKPALRPQPAPRPEPSPGSQSTLHPQSTLDTQSAPPTEDASLRRLEVVIGTPPALLDRSPLDRGVARLRIGGRVGLDGLYYDRRNTRDRRVELGAVDGQLDAEWGPRWSFRVIGDALGRDSRSGVREGWISFTPNRHARFTAGLIRATTGIEHSFRRGDHSFVGYGFQAHLDGRTDLGLMIDGEWQRGGFSYALSGLAGEGFDENGDRRTGAQLVARGVSYPARLFNRDEPSTGWARWIDGLFLNGGIRYGPSFEGHFDVAHPLRNTIFRTTRLEGEELRFQHFGYGFDWGCVRLTHEWTTGGVSELETPGGGTVDLENQITAMTFTAAWMITGEPYDSRPLVQRERPVRTRPLRPWSNSEELTDGDPGFGAWELAVRYSNADIDRRFFTTGFTRFDQSSQEFRALTVALNAHLGPELRVTAQFVRLIADQRPSAFDSHGRDSSFLLRVQWTF